MCRLLDGGLGADPSESLLLLLAEVGDGDALSDVPLLKASLR
jgi:hypothetical protein